VKRNSATGSRNVMENSGNYFCIIDVRDQRSSWAGGAGEVYTFVKKLLNKQPPLPSLSEQPHPTSPDREECNFTEGLSVRRGNEGEVESNS